MAAILAETPISADQVLLKLKGDAVRLTATLYETSELHRWLMGCGAGVEVFQPKSLRTRLRNLYGLAIKSYVGSTKNNLGMR